MRHLDTDQAHSGARPKSRASIYVVLAFAIILQLGVLPVLPKLHAGTNYLYTGQEYDPETGLYYYKSRYYDPKLGRFISPDSIIPDMYDTQEVNPYSYVTNDPMSYTDPSGHVRCDKCGHDSCADFCPRCGKYLGAYCPSKPTIRVARAAAASATTTTTTATTTTTTATATNPAAADPSFSHFDQINLRDGLIEYDLAIEEARRERDRVRSLVIWEVEEAYEGIPPDEWPLEEKLQEDDVYQIRSQTVRSLKAARERYLKLKLERTLLKLSINPDLRNQNQPKKPPPGAGVPVQVSY